MRMIFLMAIAAGLFLTGCSEQVSDKPYDQLMSQKCKESGGDRLTKYSTVNSVIFQCYNGTELLNKTNVTNFAYGTFNAGKGLE